MTDQERKEREAIIAYARGSVRLEGIVLSPAAEALAQRYIDGEISLEEHTRLGLALVRQEREAANTVAVERGTTGPDAIAGESATANLEPAARVILVEDTPELGWPKKQA